jgi:hypothetical protein
MNSSEILNMTQKQKYYHVLDIYTGQNIFHRPLNFSNIQWILRVCKILKAYNCLNIDNEIIDDDIVDFSLKTGSDEIELSYEIYDKYIRSDIKAMHDLMDRFAGCIGIQFNQQTGEPEPIMERTTEMDEIGKMFGVLDELNFLGKSITNGF